MGSAANHRLANNLSNLYKPPVRRWTTTLCLPTFFSPSWPNLLTWPLDPLQSLLCHTAPFSTREIKPLLDWVMSRRSFHGAEGVCWLEILSLLLVLFPSYTLFLQVWYAAHDIDGFLAFSSPSDEMESDCPLLSSTVYPPVLHHWMKEKAISWA